MDSLVSYLLSDNILGFEGAGKLVLNSGVSDEVAAWCCTKMIILLQQFTV